MFSRLSRNGALLLSTVLIALFFVLMVSAQDDAEATPEPEATEEMMMGDATVLEHGEYLAQIARCVSCHTPQLEQYQAEELDTEAIVTLSLRGFDALDIEDNYLAGGRAFNLGPAGTLIAGNITSDEEFGIGAWTDEELEIALRLGVLPNGEVMGRLMPTYAAWSAEDMSALIAYLRSVPANPNEVEESLYIRDPFEGDPAEALAELEYAEESASDVIERGEYLVVEVMRCTGCHTPRDPETGRPNAELYLAGGQAYEGEWGIVYGSNITPHVATGIGSWTDEQIGAVFTDGVRIDGRRLIFMPWQDYSPISEDDLSAVIAYLRSVDAVSNEIPLPAINDDFNETVVSNE